MKMFENAVDAINSNPKANALFRNKTTKLFTVRENPAGETGRYGLGHDWVLVGFTKEFKPELNTNNTYTTYQAAKIANPDQEIKTDNLGNFFVSVGHTTCNPADYCMTVKQFLDAGYKFVDGDEFIMECGQVYIAGFGGVSTDGASIPEYSDDKRYVLKAKALEEIKSEVEMSTYETMKKPSSGQDVFIAQINTLAGIESQRYHNHQYWCDSGHQNQLLELGILFTEKEDAIEKTKSLLGIKEQTKPTYRYEKVTDSIFDLKEEFENGELFSFDGNEHYVKIETEGDFSYAHIHESIFRCVEVTERELLTEALKEIWIIDGGDGEAQIERIVNSGKFKLVNGKG